MSSLDRILRWSPLQYTAHRANRSKPAVLAFHGVDDPEAFSTLMDLVRRHHHPITIQDLERAVTGIGRLPERSVLITFDDGHRSVLEHGMPIMSERGLPGMAFVIPGLLSTNDDYWWSAVVDLTGDTGWAVGGRVLRGDELVRTLKAIPDDERRAALDEMERSAGRPAAPRPQLTREDLSTLRAGGIEIGNHTWSHPCLNRCDPSTIESEIARAHTALEGALGQPPRWFAYPNGDWDPHAESVLSRLGYTIGFMFDHRQVRLGANPLRTSRLRVNSDASAERFEIILSGLHPWIHRARGRS